MSRAVRLREAMLAELHERMIRSEEIIRTHQAELQQLRHAYALLEGNAQ